MPVNTKHPDYVEYEAIWEKCNDFHDGEESVKAAGVKYLPKLSGQSNAKYEAYKSRGPFFGGVARTVSALIGAIYRKEPAITLPSKLEYLRNDATGTGMSLVELAITLTTEIMKTGRAGLLLDRSTDGGLPYLTIYDADDIVNWSTNEGSQFIVLEEDSLTSDPEDKFKLVEQESYRELTYDANGDYIVNIWKPESETLKDTFVSTTLKPTKNARAIKYIPFCCITPTGLEFDIDRPPILDMVNVLAAWFRVSTDHAHAIHTICIPTPYITGISKEDLGVLNLGPDAAIVIPEVGAKIGFLEFTGHGIKDVSEHLDKLADMLGALGARLVTSTGQKTTIETAEGARIRESMSTAVLGSIIMSVEAALAKSLRWAAEWENDDPSTVSVKLNRELVSTPIDANMLTAMLNAVNADKMSFDTFYHNLSEAGLTQPGVAIEDEIARIKANPSIVIPPAVAPTAPDKQPVIGA